MQRKTEATQCVLLQSLSRSSIPASLTNSKSISIKTSSCVVDGGWNGWWREILSVCGARWLGMWSMLVQLLAVGLLLVVVSPLCRLLCPHQNTKTHSPFPRGKPPAGIDPLLYAGDSTSSYPLDGQLRRWTLDSDRRRATTSSYVYLVMSRGWRRSENIYLSCNPSSFHHTIVPHFRVVWESAYCIADVESAPRVVGPL
jgi:hypothetical protein